MSEIANSALNRILKVQTPAIRLRSRAGPLWFGAHNFVAIADAEGRIVRELHGIARGPLGAELKIYGGVLSFQMEYIRGEIFERRTGFYDLAFPQGELAVVDDRALTSLMAAARRVRDEINRRDIRYPWPALFGANSNAYYATLIAGMGLTDRRIDGQLWAPSSSQRLLTDHLLREISAATLRTTSASDGQGS